MIARDVLFARAVARLARDSELGDLRVELAARVDARLAERGVARDAARVPAALRGRRQRLRRLEEDRVARHPALIALQVCERKLAEAAVVAGLVPVDLHVMRSGDERDRAALRVCARRRRDVDEEVAVA